MIRRNSVGHRRSPDVTALASWTSPHDEFRETKDECRGRTILVVAACDDSRELLVKSLRASDFDVQCAGSAADCIRIVRQTTPGVIVMDRVLPDGDGWELVRILRSLSSTRGVPVIALTEEDSLRYRKRAFVLGCDVFLVKPFEPETLLRQIRRLHQAFARSEL